VQIQQPLHPLLLLAVLLLLGQQQSLTVSAVTSMVLTARQEGVRQLNS
jgi:hypothetical protein